MARISEMTRLATLQQAVVMTPQALQLSRHARRVYVGNLPPNITETSITHYFNQVGRETDRVSQAASGSHTAYCSMYCRQQCVVGKQMALQHMSQATNNP